MATKRSQRIAIWVIAITLAVGTIGSFVVMILANDNQQQTQARLDQLMAEYDKQIEEYGEKVKAQSDALSDTYYDQFAAYRSRAKAYNADSVTELKTNDLKQGTGETISEDSTYTAYYMGWNPKGTIFDSSFAEDKKALDTPLSVAPGGMITGWTQGTAGMKVGGVREISIPAELAYDEMGRGEDIPPNTPIKFVVMVIPTPETIEYPQPSEELLRLYSRIQ